MPSNVTLPTFTNREILLYQKLNAAFQAISARFAAGISSSELGWPLTAEEDLIMGAWDIQGGRSFWNVFNSATTNYATFQDAVDAAGSGGVVLVPPDTTIVTAGVDLPANITIVGAGPSSVLQLTGSTSAAYLLSAAAGGAYGPLITNLTLDGNSATGSGASEGLVLAGVTEVGVSNVWFKNFKGAMLRIKTGCDNVNVADCHFNGGSAEHIYVTECDKLNLSNLTCDGADTITIRMECASNTANISATLNNIQISGCGTSAIKFLGYNNVGTASPGAIYANNVVVQDTGTGVFSVILGSATATLDTVQWHGGSIVPSATGGMQINANDGSVSGVSIATTAGTGVDLDVSKFVTVHDCVFRSCAIGIDGGTVATGSKCEAHSNTYDSCTIETVPGVGFWPYGRNAVRTWVFTANKAFTTGATSSFTLVTLPAHSVKPGDVLVVEFCVSCAAVDDPLNTITSYFGAQGLDALPTTAGGSSVHSRSTLIVSTTTTGRTYQESWDQSTPGIGVGAATTFDTATEEAISFTAVLNNGAPPAQASLTFARATLFSGTGVA